MACQHLNSLMQRSDRVASVAMKHARCGRTAKLRYIHWIEDLYVARCGMPTKTPAQCATNSAQDDIGRQPGAAALTGPAAPGARQPLLPPLQPGGPAASRTHVAPLLRLLLAAALPVSKSAKINVETCRCYQQAGFWLSSSGSISHEFHKLQYSRATASQFVDCRSQRTADSRHSNTPLRLVPAVPSDAPQRQTHHKRRPTAGRSVRSNAAASAAAASACAVMASRCAVASSACFCSIWTAVCAVRTSLCVLLNDNDSVLLVAKII